jgi:hypothetical protein
LTKPFAPLSDWEALMPWSRQTTLRSEYFCGIVAGVQYDVNASVIEDYSLVVSEGIAVALNMLILLESSKYCQKISFQCQREDSYNF